MPDTSLEIIELGRQDKTTPGQCVCFCFCASSCISLIVLMSMYYPTLHCTQITVFNDYESLTFDKKPLCSCQITQWNLPFNEHVDLFRNNYNHCAFRYQTFSGELGKLTTYYLGVRIEQEDVEGHPSYCPPETVRKERCVWHIVNTCDTPSRYLRGKSVNSFFKINSIEQVNELYLEQEKTSNAPPSFTSYIN